ncbi:MAG: hypothetical protein OEY59_01395 [Deltaproteobacteria bacterium]|nr:hypothetical protein [Deltaproteobacteria bacterium]
MYFSKLKSFILIALLSCGFYSGSALAQVITPSLDPTQPIAAPSPAGWVNKMSAGVGYTEQSGNRELGGIQEYEFDTKGTSVNLAVSFKNFYLSASSFAYNTATKLNIPIEGPYNIKDAGSQINLSLVGNQFVSIGLGARVAESTDYLSALMPEAINKEQSTLGNISISVKEIFFIGGGIERVKRSNDYEVQGLWSNTSAGIALKLGQPSGVQFRTEISSTTSPETANAPKGALLEAKHYKTATTRYAMEIMFSGLIFSALKVEKSTNEPYIDQITLQNSTTNNEANTQGGVLWIPEQGLVLGFYFNNIYLERDYNDKHSSFRIQAGYVF